MSNHQDLLEEIKKLSQDLNIPLVDSGAPQSMIGGSDTPPNAPPAIAMDETTEGTSQQRMETLGYMYIDGRPPNPSHVTEIMETFDEGVKIEDGPTTHIEGGSVCFDFLESGIGESVSGSQIWK